MKVRVTDLIVLVALSVGVMAAQAPVDPPAAVAPFVRAARNAAGQDHLALLNNICAPPPAPPATPAGGGTAAQAQGPPPAPPRDQWYAPPAKVFDNLYFVGQSAYTAWAVTTSQGIIIIDPLFEYSVEEQIVNGLPKLGLDPKTIRYVIVSHAHRDHVAGAALLQNRFGARVVMSADDWELLETDPGGWPKARRDMVATDGQRLVLGDTTLTLYLTPGHTAGTISTLIPVKDGARTHTALLWGGTAFNWRSGSPRYIQPGRPATWWYDSYAASAGKMREIAQALAADVILSNHPPYDDYKAKQSALAARTAGRPHPWVVGSESVRRFLTVAEECAKAGPLWVNPPR